MSLAFSIPVFYTIWWVVLFAVLPFGAHSYAETGAEHPLGTDPGAPVLHHIGRKLLITTAASAVVFAAIDLFIIYET
ncbi:MAG TPA: DUF1467 family protein [Roseiarcus sp.]|nr:DUF1467 family protein [Roseiarcus sp.]